MGVLNFILNPRNRSLLLLIGGALLCLLFLRQCNQSRQLREQLEAAKAEARRVENNYLASIDTIRQSYDSRTGMLTASIRGYELTVEELEGKYADLFAVMKDWKGKPPITVVEKHFYVTEHIKSVDISSTPVDSLGQGMITFADDTVFSVGNSRSVSGSFPYAIRLLDKSDSTILDYQEQPFFASLHPGKGEVDLKQEMTLYTGLNRDSKTGEVTTWVKTAYPGVTFKVLKGATIQDDEATRKALVSSRKTLGIGFSTGAGMVYTNNGTVQPGIFLGVGLNFSPKKLQFGR